mgnify:CR=1 FL=1
MPSRRLPFDFILTMYNVGELRGLPVLRAGSDGLKLPVGGNGRLGIPDEPTAVTLLQSDDADILNVLQQYGKPLVAPFRALNCLKAADVDTVGDLVKLNRNDLLKFRNFGKKSLTELDELLTSLNLKFGMDVSIYKLDKD